MRRSIHSTLSVRVYAILLNELFFFLVLLVSAPGDQGSGLYSSICSDTGDHREPSKMTEAIGGFSPNLSSTWPESPLYYTGHHRDPTSQGQRAPTSTTTPSNPGLGDTQQISARVNKLSLLWDDSLYPHADKQPSVHLFYTTACPQGQGLVSPRKSPPLQVLPPRSLTSLMQVCEYFHQKYTWILIL